MIFYGEPNMLVRISKQSPRNLRHFRFDNEGKYETDNPRLIRLLKRRFEYDEEKPLKQCKKCDFTCDNQGELLQHYKNVHPKK